MNAAAEGTVQVGARQVPLTDPLAHLAGQSCLTAHLGPPAADGFEPLRPFARRAADLLGARHPDRPAIAASMAGRAECRRPLTTARRALDAIVEDAPTG